MQVVVGIDIGGTFTKFGVIDKEGNVLAHSSIPTTGHPQIQSYLTTLKEAIDELVWTTDKDLEVVGVGIGAPNGNFYKGTIEYAPNLSWKGIIPIIDEFKKLWNLPMVLTNDANAAALGEMTFGAAKGLKNFIVITLGTGLGSGLVVNGHLVYGHDGFAGELGHVTVVPGGRFAGTGRRGSLEAYVSAPGIRRTVFELLAEYLDESEFRDVTYNQLTAKMITEAAKRGDKIALEAFRRTGQWLGQALADTVAHTSPEAIFLFGGLANAGDFILKPTKEYLEENLLQIYKNKVRIELSGLKEANAAVLGAGGLAWQELFDK